MNVRAAFVHVIGDLVQSIGVLVAALVIKVRLRTSLMHFSDEETGLYKGLNTKKWEGRKKIEMIYARRKSLTVFLLL